MFKKALTAILLFAACLPVLAAKDLSAVQWGERKPVEVTFIDDVLEVAIKYNRMKTVAYIANLDCHEYSRTYTLKSTTHKTFVRPRQRTVRITREVTEYVKKLFKENEGNIFFAADGYGLYYNLVGEFFIGNDSLSKHLIEKGYCVYVD